MSQIENTNIPKDFNPLDLGKGFGERFGTIYIKENPVGIKLGFLVQEHHSNGYGACHGGAIASFADMQVLVAKNSPRIKGFHTPTISLSIDYIAPLKVGDWVEMSAEVLKISTNIIFTRALMTVKGKVAVQTSAKYIIPVEKNRISHND